MGDLSWSDLNSIFNASEINAGIDFYKNWHESVSFSDTGSPTLVRVYSKSDDVGNNPVVDSAPVIYHPGDSFNITAEFSEEILAGSSITVTFNTGVDVVLEAQENSQFMIGSYIVTRGLHTNTPDLSVVSISINEPVYDLYGNALVDIPLPSGGENAFANIENIKITTPNTAPELDTLSDQTTQQDASFRYQLSATDIDLDISDESLSYELVSGPDGLSSTGFLSGTPTNEEIG